ncbi:MAG: TetR/AcrR family transcriptional regulator [Chrysiogenetes bacterium]|nr:TetR/AcrR family transcriptional regulator [Chrysiogenetes bacterium]
MSEPEKKQRKPSARAEKSKEAIVAAFVELVREGNRRPTAPVIAERAGVSERLVYHHFKDMKRLLLESHRINRPVVAPLLEDLIFEGTFKERRDYFVKARAKAYEFVQHNRRYSYHHAFRSREISDFLLSFWQTEGAQFCHVFAEELEKFSGEERATREANLRAVCSWNYWEILRQIEGLSVARAKAAVSKAITQILLVS